MKFPELNDLCCGCGHEYKFHVDSNGTIQPCDVEPRNLNTADDAAEPELCGCPQFEQLADPDEALESLREKGVVGECLGFEADEEVLLTTPTVPTVSRCSICGEEGGEHATGCVLNDEVK